MDNKSNTPQWAARHSAFRETKDFSDLLRIVASYYDMYSRAHQYVAPWISRNAGKSTLPIDKDEIKSSLGKDRPTISHRAKTAFTEAVYQFVLSTKGTKTLITPSPSSHHSAQFPSGTFYISVVKDNLTIMDNNVIRKSRRPLYCVELSGAEYPIFVEELKIPIDQIKFIIVRPMLGKLGAASASKWEILFYKKDYGYIIDHVDSQINPRYSGTL